MNTLNFLDSNVWLALIWSRHAHSERARSWFAQAAEQQFFFCRFTQLTVLRLLTTESVMAKETKTMSEAWALWDRVWADAYLLAFAAASGLKFVTFDKGLRARGEEVLVL